MTWLDDLDMLLTVAEFPVMLALTCAALYVGCLAAFPVLLAAVAVWYWL